MTHPSVDCLYHSGFQAGTSAIERHRESTRAMYRFDRTIEILHSQNRRNTGSSGHYIVTAQSKASELMIT